MNISRVAQLTLSAEGLNTLLAKCMIWLRAQLDLGATTIEPFLVVAGFTSAPDPQYHLWRFEALGEDKPRMLRQAGEYLVGQGLIGLAVVLVSEAWMVADALATEPLPRPSADPRRIEAVVWMGRTVDGRAMFAAYPIERAPDNHIRLGPAQAEHGFNADGPAPESPLLQAFFAGVDDGMQKRAAAGSSAGPGQRLRDGLTGLLRRQKG